MYFEINARTCSEKCTEEVWDDSIFDWMDKNNCSEFFETKEFECE